MKILVWVTQEGISDAEFARRCGWNGVKGKVKAHRIIRQGQVPSKPDMQTIFDVTGEQVTANDFYDIPATEPVHDAAPKENPPGCQGIINQS